MIDKLRLAPAAPVVTTILASIALGACVRTPVDPARVTGLWGTSPDLRPGAPPPPLLSSVNTLLAAYREAAADSDDHRKAHFFAMAGIAVSDELCGAWFDALGKAQANDGFYKDLVTNTGGLAAVLLEITRAGAGPVAGAAAGSTFLTNTIDSHVANFIVAPDLGAVKDTIEKTRAARAAEIKDADLSFPEAYSAVVRYDHSCSHIEIKRIVTESLKKAGDKALEKKDTLAIAPARAPAAVPPPPAMAPPILMAPPGPPRSSRFRGTLPPPVMVMPPAAPPSGGASPQSTIRQAIPGLSPSIE